jgi:hypothetical protein
VKNEEVLLRVSEQRNILHETRMNSGLFIKKISVVSGHNQRCI